MRRRTDYSSLTPPHQKLSNDVRDKTNQMLGSALTGWSSQQETARAFASILGANPQQPPPLPAIWKSSAEDRDRFLDRWNETASLGKDFSTCMQAGLEAGGLEFQADMERYLQQIVDKKIAGPDPDKVSQTLDMAKRAQLPAKASFLQEMTRSTNPEHKASFEEMAAKWNVPSQDMLRAKKAWEADPQAPFHERILSALQTGGPEFRKGLRETLQTAMTENPEAFEANKRTALFVNHLSENLGDRGANSSGMTNRELLSLSSNQALADDTSGISPPPPSSTRHATNTRPALGL